MKRGGHQPYKRGQARPQGPALRAMQRGAPANAPHPSAVKRALMKRNGKRPKSALARAFAKRGL